MSLEQSPAMEPGTKVVLRGREFTLPPLPLGSYRLVQESEQSGKFSAQALIDAFLLVFRINYPNVTPEEVESLLDMQTAMDLFAKLAAVSGVQSTPGGTEVGKSDGGVSTDG